MFSLYLSMIADFEALNNYRKAFKKIKKNQ